MKVYEVQQLDTERRYAPLRTVAVMDQKKAADSKAYELAERTNREYTVRERSIKD